MGKKKNNKILHKNGVFPPKFIYPFFLFHMLMFGLSGFIMAYFAEDVELSFLYMHGGIAIFVYIVFYIVIFGIDEVKWLFINSALGFFGIYAEIGLMLRMTGRDISDYSPYVHVTPFLYYILYTFLIRQLIIDIFKARHDEKRLRTINTFYVVLSLLIYSLIYFSNR